MKIGIEAQRLFRAKKHGMDLVALELIRNLQQIDKQNEYVIFVNPDVDRTCIQQTSNFKIAELKNGFYPVWEQYTLPKAAQKEKCDILHCTSNTAPIFSKIPLMITLHDIIYLESISLLKKSGTWYQKFGNFYRRLVVPQVVKNSKIIITVSEFEKNRINNFFGFRDDKLHAVYNGVSSHFKKITDSEFLRSVRIKYNLPEKFLFFLGNTDPKKNVKGVLLALKQLNEKSDKKFPLVMLDYKKENLIRDLETLNCNELLNQIILPGYISNSDLPAIYNLSMVFLYPSLRESFGIPMLEAMSCGTVVITSTTSSMPEVAGDAALLINPLKPEEICDAILKIINDENLKNELIEKGFERASKFTWKSMAENVLQLYCELYAKSKKQV